MSLYAHPIVNTLTSPFSYCFTQKRIRVFASSPSSGVYGRSTWISSSLMNTFYTGASGAGPGDALEVLGEGNASLGTSSVMSRVSPSAHGSDTYTVTGVKCEGESAASVNVGACRELEGQRK